MRHDSLVTPRDFAASSYCRIVKPTFAQCFEDTAMPWAHAAGPTATSP